MAKDLVEQKVTTTSRAPGRAPVAAAATRLQATQFMERCLRTAGRPFSMGDVADAPKGRFVVHLWPRKAAPITLPDPPLGVTVTLHEPVSVERHA